MIVSHPIGARFLVVALALLSFAAPASAFQFGTEDDSVLLQDWWGDPNVALERSHELDARTIRHIVPWALIETAPRVYDWSPLDVAVNRERSAGFRVLLTMGGTSAPPAWDGVGSAPAVHAYAAWVGTAAMRYRGLVSEWTLYNEPDYNISPRIYRALFVAGRRAIKRAQPHARVYVADVTGSAPIKYMQAVLRYGALHADGFAWHPYQYTREPSDSLHGRPDAIGIGKIARLRRWLKRRDVRRRLSTPSGHALPLYATEFGYINAGPWSTPHAAQWWPKVIREAQRNGVRLLISYQLYPDERVGSWDSSILTRSGAPTHTFAAISRTFTAIRAARTTKRHPEGRRYGTGYVISPRRSASTTA